LRQRPSDDLNDAFVWKEECILSRALTLHWDKALCILKPNEQAKAAVGERATVVDYPDGLLSIRYRGVKRAYLGFDKLRPSLTGPDCREQANKQLGAALVFIREGQFANLSVAAAHVGALRVTSAFSTSAEQIVLPQLSDCCKRAIPRSSSLSRIMSSFWRRSIQAEIALRKCDFISNLAPKPTRGAHPEPSIVGGP
jgi:hypothetical protein